VIVTYELAELRQFLGALQSGALAIRENQKDVTQRELVKLNRDIESLEIIRTRSRKRRGDS
jgi:hypothetical protein